MDRTHGARLDGIQMMRGMAATLVVIGHALTIRAGLGIDRLATESASIFPIGVDIFFVVSGFIISHRISIERLGGPGDAATFFVRRITRIYPLYWVVLIASWLIIGHLASNPYDSIPVRSGLSLIFLSTAANWLVPQAWTLAFEMYFYVAVTCIIFTTRHAFPCVFVWLAVQVIAALVWGDVGIVCVHPLVLEFGFGCLIYWLWRHRPCNRVVAVLTASIPFFCVGAILSGILLGAWTPVAGWTRVLTYGVGAAVLVYSVAGVSSASLVTRIMRYLGDASYSLYLSHTVVLVSFLALANRTGLFTATPVALRPYWAIWLIVLAMSVGLMSYTYLERPMLRLSRAMLTR